MREASDALLRRAWASTARRVPALRAVETRRWVAHHRRSVASALADRTLLDRFRRGEQLPEAYGADLDERVIEFPWALAQAPRGRALDAGSALNHRHVLPHFRSSVTALHVVTLVPEEMSFPELDVSYIYADLRDLPMKDGLYDTVISISTLEHVGMDNSGYGAPGAAAADPAEATRVAVRELRRVLAPAGRLLITVPYGAGEDHGWLRQFTRPDLEDVVATAQPAEFAITVYRRAPSGWQLSDPVESRSARYVGHKAGAVACISLRLP
jgi:SAM-dependent methyltransferase